MTTHDVSRARRAAHGFDPYQPAATRDAARDPAPDAPAIEGVDDERVDTAAAAFVDAVRAVVHSLRGASRTAEQQLGVHGAELLVLRKLADTPSASLAELAARTQTDPSTASVVVRGLVERGLLARSVAPDDRRRTPIAITAAGRRVLHQAPAPAHTRVARAAGPLGEPELRVLAAQLGALAERLTRDRSGSGGAGAGDDVDV